MNEQYSDDFITECVPGKLKLFPFQYSGVRFLAERKRALIASDPGTGKTVMLITAVNTIAVERLADPKKLNVLVLCPKSMKLTWGREIEKWSTGRGNQINWEVHNWDKLVYEKRVADLKKTKWDIIIGDESHQAIKNPGAVRCKVFLKKMITGVERVWIATATPASKSGLDYYCTLCLLLPGLVDKWTARSFEQQFCERVPDPFSPAGYVYKGFANLHILKELFSKCCIRHRKEVVLPDLPPKRYSNIEVVVPESIVADFLDINEDYVASLIEKGEPLPGHIAHVMQACALAKVDDVVDLVSNYPEGESLVLFAWHRSVVHALVKGIKGIGREVESITGEITSEIIRQNIVDRFQKKELKLLVLNMQSGGVGLTLTAASTAIYIELPHSPIHLVQSENRIHRIGTEHRSVNIVRVLGKGTIDESIFRTLDYRIKSMEKVGV